MLLSHKNKQWKHQNKTTTTNPPRSALPAKTHLRDILQEGITQIYFEFIQFI